MKYFPSAPKRWLSIELFYFATISIKFIKGNFDVSLSKSNKLMQWGRFSTKKEVEVLNYRFNKDIVRACMNEVCVNIWWESQSSVCMLNMAKSMMQWRWKPSNDDVNMYKDYTKKECESNMRTNFMISMIFGVWIFYVLHILGCKEILWCLSILECIFSLHFWDAEKYGDVSIFQSTYLPYNIMFLEYGWAWWC